ncbi:LLM class flavin-dependent oxidoreductase [Peribacillus sp. JNUCC 23]|uniref:LLM class flavin-dependent oxidoreductase n=1 Tax=Peribacillus sp. NPDC096379 TaxID=3364393 RepID=UPI00381B749C
MSQSKKQLSEIPLSVLDLANITEGSTPAESFKHTLDLAQHVEKWGFNRFWLAEHHSMPGIASSATSVVIGYVAAGTSTLKVGSGGIMLPNHSPLVIAEQFGTLESMYPGRIDLGLGRAPGSDQFTAMALRRDIRNTGDDFPEQLEQLRTYFDAESRHNRVRAIPGEGLNVPIWLLGSSGFSAKLAGSLGLPFSFASHFAPENTMAALEIYRSNFQPSDVLSEPYAMVGINVYAADTEAEAAYLATSYQQQFLSLIRNTPNQLQPPVDSMDGLWTPYEKASIQSKLDASVIGNPEQVKEKLQAFLDKTGADEMIINSGMFHHEPRLRSYEIIAEIADKKHS